MKMGLSQAFINTIKCDKCGNKVMYDDTPYSFIKKLKHLQYELACVICGRRMIFSRELKQINHRGEDGSPSS